MSEQKRKYILGIDPSFVTMGAALYDPKTKELKLRTGEFQSVVRWIGANVKLSEVVAMVENPAMNSPVFKMWGMVQQSIKDLIMGKIDKTKAWTEVHSKFSIAMKFAQSVGENKAAAKMIIRLLKEKNVPILEVAPSEREKAYKQKGKTKIRKKIQFLKWPTKTDRNQFYELTGCNKVCSEHARDAATLPFGYSIVQVMHLIRLQQEKNKNKPKSFPGSHNNNYSLFKNNEQ